MATLIISDIHERLDRLALALQSRISKADRVVFLGDWFDAFGPVDLRRVGQVCGFLNSNIDGLEYEGRTIPATFLLGNHDCHYFFRHAGFKCSGYDPRKHDVIYANVANSVIDMFGIFTKVGPYLVSHAGFTEATLQYAKPEVEADALQTARKGGFDPIFGAGYARGGNQPVGGPTWLDWANEFDHIDDCPQIVGHTNGQKVRSKGGDAQLKSWCLDTALRNCAWVDEETGVITIEEVVS